MNVTGNPFATRRRSSLVRLCAPVLIGIALAASRSAADVDTIPILKHDLQAAVNTGNADRIVAVRARFQTLAAAEPQSAELQYWMATADWRAVPLIRDNKERAKKRCEAGIAAADEALRLNPKLAEALAVKAGLEGLSLSFKNPAAGMTLGPQMEKEMGQALGIAPDNPRIHLMDAINTLHKPGFVGGGAERALPKFQKAIELFGAETVSDTSAPDWGRDDAFLWAGRAAMKLKDYPAARDYFAKALETNPDNGWVRHVLLPGAEKALAGNRGDKSKS